MPKVLKSLTNTEIAAAKPQKTEYMLRDGDGLALLIKPSGRKIWYFEYTPPALKKRTKISIGPYPVVTLAMARDFRLQYRRLLVQGIDPQAHLEQVAEEQRLQNECTLEKVAEQWLKEKKRTSDLSEDHAKDVWRSLEMHVFPSLGNTPVTEIRPKMLKEHLTPLEEQGILETLRRVISRLNEIFRFAISEELIEFNPADNLIARFKKPKKQNMPALHPSELGRLMLALQNASIRKETRCLIEWELLTWVRPGEAVSARWCDIDMKKAEWRIPDTFMKMNRSHTVPLSKQALRVLQVMEPVSRHRPWVFPSIRKPLEHMHQQTANAALIRMGFGGELVAHGMRSIARTAGAGHFPREVLESALAHQKEDEIEAAYNRSDYLEQRRPLMQWWGNYVDAARRQALIGEEEPLQIVEGE
ncbi:integrase domain-containing protein [Enterobacter chuandaensis]|uniref:integrase domain-containing protein n=1 Tax=Enterobacter chuandaensis TaxID=2497875 RepID=UPI00300C7F4F